MEQSNTLLKMFSSPDKEDVVMGLAILEKYNFIDNFATIMILLRKSNISPKTVIEHAPDLAKNIAQVIPSKKISDINFETRVFLEAGSYIQLDNRNQQMILDFLIERWLENLKQYGYDVEEMTIKLKSKNYE